jgi:hypothetical protein
MPHEEPRIGSVIEREGGGVVKRIYASMLLPGDVLVAVVHGDGKLKATIAPVHRAGPSGLWGCATCEQFHPTEAAACPLLGHPTEKVVIGPYEIDGDPVCFVGTERARALDDQPAPESTS